jgi:hypothetical protein
MKLAIARYSPALQVLDLMHDVPAYDVRGAAYLLAAQIETFPAGTICAGVVDPGVGSDRVPLLLCADGRWFTGPDNGLFDQVAARAEQVQAWRLTWQPERLSVSFHGRDLFAPVAAMLATGVAAPETLGTPLTLQQLNWPQELAQIIYIDRYGNAMTGIRAQTLTGTAVLRVAGQQLKQALTFSSVPPGDGFWYENSCGLVEFAVNQGDAAARWGLQIGMEVQVVKQGCTQIHDN